MMPELQGAPAIVAASALRGFPELVRELGGDPDALLREAQIDVDALTTRDAVIEYRSLLRVMQSAADSLSCPDFGLQLAALQGGNKAIGPIGVVMKNSKTLGQAIGYCAKHIHAYSLATRVRFEPDRERHLLLLRLEILLQEPEERSQAIEHAFMLACLNIREITAGVARVRKILFRHAQQSTRLNYQSRFGCQVLFGQRVDGLVLTEQDLLRPVVDPDDRVYEMATSFIETRYPKTQAPLLSQVRHRVLQGLDSKNCTCERIAAELCVHPRTLQRRLRAAGTSFEDIKDAVRRDVALRYLQRDDMLFKHVAEKLGYSDPSIFSRSCFRWFSTTPSKLRSQLKSQLHG
ncbi:AraC family transcriptional regulator ligand-binding domain-containing protein [Steroidobacter flavus]|uniref:AraC family transcriptional regulator ligand-binding domain-containing protein n=1 Tax=Steroidobacter flavus TaxID=1842136 RepID=A0ABV8SZJ7_9GAMM